MNNLSKQMQERLDKWRKNTIPTPSLVKVKEQGSFRRGSKGDRGDAMTQEEWDEEARKSQTRK